MIPWLNPSYARYTGISWVLLFIYEVKSSTILLSSCPCLFGTGALSHISGKLIAYTRQLSEGWISLARSWCTSHSWLSRLANVPSADDFVSTHGGTSSNQPDPQCPHTYKHGYITHWSMQLRRQQFCTIFMGQFQGSFGWRPSFLQGTHHGNQTSLVLETPPISSFCSTTVHWNLHLVWWFPSDGAFKKHPAGWVYCTSAQGIAPMEAPCRLVRWTRFQMLGDKNDPWWGSLRDGCQIRMGSMTINPLNIPWPHVLTMAQYGFMTFDVCLSLYIYIFIYIYLFIFQAQFFQGFQFNRLAGPWRVFHVSDMFVGCPYAAQNSPKNCHQLKVETYFICSY